jgi:hypothetical protein
MLRNVESHVRPESLCLNEDNESDSEHTRCVLDSIERRLNTLERTLYAMCRDRQSDQKRRTTFEYIESWLSTTVHQTTRMRGEEKVHVAADLAKKDAMAY